MSYGEYEDERDRGYGNDGRGVQRNGSYMGQGQPQGTNRTSANPQNQPGQPGFDKSIFAPPFSGPVPVGSFHTDTTPRDAQGQAPVTDTSRPQQPIQNPFPVNQPGAGRPSSPNGQGQRYVGLSGRENPANFAGTMNSAIWDDPNSQELNRRALRIISRYGNNLDAVQQAMRDPDWLADPDLAGATFDGRDKLDFHGALSEEGGVPVNFVDIMQAFDQATGQSRGLQWIDQNFVGAGPGPQQGMGQFAQSTLPADSLYSSIQSSILGGQGGQQQPQGQQAAPNNDTFMQLLQQLLGGNMQTPDLKTFLSRGGTF